MYPVFLPLIKKLDPVNIADLICDVQQMTDSTADVFKLTMVKPRLTSTERKVKEGDRRHVANRGWQVYYGSQWIPEAVWWKVKIAGF